MVNPLIRWEPLELEDVQNRLSKLFGRRTNGRDEITLADWAPLADITEDEKEYLIKAELPDVKKEDVKVTVENGVLTISGERKFEKEEEISSSGTRLRQLYAQLQPSGSGRRKQS